jgi:hypothetical protein
MGTKSSLPYSQGRVTDLYPEPDKSIPHLSALFLQDPF